MLGKLHGAFRFFEDGRGLFERQVFNESQDDDVLIVRLELFDSAMHLLKLQLYRKIELRDGGNNRGLGVKLVQADIVMVGTIMIDHHVPRDLVKPAREWMPAVLV